MVGDECFVGAGRGHQPGREDLPVQDGRGGRGRHVVDRVGEPGRPHAVRPAGRARARQRRHHARGRGAARDGLRHRAEEGLGRHHEPRHEPRRAGAEAGDDRRPQPHRRQRGGPRARDGAAHALPGAQQPVAGRHHRAPRARRPRQRRDPLLRRRRRATSTRATQRKIERLLYREDFRRAFAGDIGDIVFPPRSLEFYTAALERVVDIDQVRSAGFKVVLDYSFGAASIVMPNVLAKLGAEVLAVNPFASTSSATSTAEVRDAQVAPARRARARVGQRPRLRVRPRRRAGGRRRRHAVTCSSPRSCSSHRRARQRRRARAPRVAVPVNVTERGRADRWATPAHGRVDEAVGCAASWRRRSARRSTFAASHDGGFIWPDFLPAYDAAATLVQLLDLLAAVDRPLSTVVADAARDPRRARDVVDAVGAQGHGDARDRRAGRATRERCSSTA